MVSYSAKFIHPLARASVKPFQVKWGVKSQSNSGWDTKYLLRPEKKSHYRFFEFQPNFQIEIVKLGHEKWEFQKCQFPQRNVIRYHHILTKGKGTKILQNLMRLFSGRSKYLEPFICKLCQMFKSSNWTSNTDFAVVC